MKQIKVCAIIFPVANTQYGGGDEVVLKNAYLCGQRTWSHLSGDIFKVYTSEGPVLIQLAKPEPRDPEAAMTFEDAFLGVVTAEGWRIAHIYAESGAIAWYERELPDKAQTKNAIDELRAALKKAGLLKTPTPC